MKLFSVNGLQIIKAGSRQSLMLAMSYPAQVSLESSVKEWILVVAVQFKTRIDLISTSL
jgi:hypothetical protein